MTDTYRNESNLEQRLRNHYQQRYEQPPDPAKVWTHLSQHLDAREKTGRWWNSVAFARTRKWSSLSGAIFAMKHKPASEQIKDDFIQIDTGVNEELSIASVHRTHATRDSKSRRRLQHAVESGVAVLLVASLLIAWLALTTLHNGQNTANTAKPVFTYTSLAGETVYDIKWTPDRKYLTFVLLQPGTNRFRFLVWNSATGALRQTMTINLPLNTLNSPSGNIDDSLDGQYALIASYDKVKQLGTVKLANILTGHIDLVYQGDHYNAFPAVAFSNDSKKVAFVGSEGRIHIRDIATKKTILTSDSIGGVIIGSHAQMMSWSPDGKRIITETLLFTPGNPMALQVWNALTGRRLYKIVDTPSMSLPTEVVSSEQGFNQIGGSTPDGERLLTYNRHTGILTVRASSTSQALQTFHIQIGESNGGTPLWLATWLANGTRIILATGQSTYILNPITGQTLLTLSTAVLWQQNGRYVASPQKGNLLGFWDTTTGAKIALIHLPTDLAYFSWLSDGRHINVAVKNGSGQLYDAVTGKLFITYKGDAAFLSEDGKYIATQDTVLDTKHGGVLKSIVQVIQVHY